MLIDVSNVMLLQACDTTRAKCCEGETRRRREVKACAANSNQAPPESHARGRALYEECAAEASVSLHHGFDPTGGSA